MRPQCPDSLNAHDLVKELDHATELMMSIPVEQVGSLHWKEAFVRQQSAFRTWREYLYLKADSKPAAHSMGRSFEKVA